MNSGSTKSDCAAERAQFRAEVVTYRSEHTIRAAMERFQVSNEFYLQVV